MATLNVVSDAPSAVAEVPPAIEAELPEVHAPGRKIGKADQFAQATVLALLFAAPAVMCVRFACVNDPDIWWHLRTGEWMLQHHAVARVDAFSSSNLGKPWAAYSWLFEMLTFGLFRRIGLVGIVGYSASMMLAITVALWHLIKRLQADFSIVMLLTFATCFSLGHLYTPRPWLFTILFFVLEVDILMQARRTGRLRELMWLPAIFALWANIHIQFIDGLLVLGLALAESIFARQGIGEKTRLGAPWAAAAFAGSVAATFLNPFGWHIYRVAYELASQSGVMDKISELQAIRFRDPVDYCLLFLALGATAALARARRFHVFESGLLIFAAVLSFRSQRDVWIMATAAAAILASMVTTADRPRVRMPKFAAPLSLVAASLLVLGSFRLLHVNQAKLQSQLDDSLPVRAVDTIRAHNYPGPLYNDFTWGGYLIWALRMPVSLDGRSAFYGDQAIDRSVATWRGEPDWSSDPQLKSAGLIVGPDKSALTQLLRTDPRFKLVYEDKVAVVFVQPKSAAK